MLAIHCVYIVLDMPFHMGAGTVLNNMERTLYSTNDIIVVNNNESIISSA